MEVINRAFEEILGSGSSPEPSLLHSADPFLPPNLCVLNSCFSLNRRLFRRPNFHSSRITRQRHIECHNILRRSNKRNFYPFLQLSQKKTLFLFSDPSQQPFIFVLVSRCFPTDLTSSYFYCTLCLPAFITASCEPERYLAGFLFFQYKNTHKNFRFCCNYKEGFNTFILSCVSFRFRSSKEKLQ